MALMRNSADSTHYTHKENRMRQDVQLNENFTSQYDNTKYFLIIDADEKYKPAPDDINIILEQLREIESVVGYFSEGCIEHCGIGHQWNVEVHPSKYDAEKKEQKLILKIT